MIFIFLFIQFKEKTNQVTDNLSVVINNMLEFTNWTLNPYLPTCWITRIFFSISDINPEKVFLHINLLFSFSFVLVLLMIIINNEFGFDAWSKYISRTQKGDALSIFNPLYKLFMHSKLITNRTAVIIAKDVQVFLRDPVQYLQFLIFFGILMVYIINMKNMHYDITNPFWKNLITYLNLASICLILATLSTRFIFPQISLEGKGAWVISMTPYKFSKLILIKFVYSFVFSFIITAPMIAVSNMMLKINSFTFFVTSLIYFTTLITLCALSIGLGAIFPNFKAHNSAAIVSGFGGTFTLIISLFYVTLSVSIPAFMEHLHIKSYMDLLTLKSSIFVFLICHILLSGYITFYVLKKGIRNLDTLDM